MKKKTVEKLNKVIDVAGDLIPKESKEPTESKETKELNKTRKIENNMDHFEEWKRGKNVGPLVIEVAPTYGCNHGCIHCGFQQFDPYGANNIFKETSVRL